MLQKKMLANSLMLSYSVTNKDLHSNDQGVEHKEIIGMETVLKSASGYQTVSIEAILNSKRVIFINGSIDDEMAMTVVQQATYLAQEDSSKPIKMLINSCGGEIDAGMVIYDILQSCPAPIKVYCTGKAYSMGATLLCCGKHGRYLLPHSRVMIHEPLAFSGVGGKTSSIQTMAESMLKVKDEMIAILAKHTGQPIEKLNEMTKTDTFFSADEAVEFGLADKVVDFAEVLK